MVWDSFTPVIKSNWNHRAIRAFMFVPCIFWLPRMTFAEPHAEAEAQPTACVVNSLYTCNSETLELRSLRLGASRVLNK